MADDLEGTPLHDAAASHRGSTMTKFLISNGANINKKTIYSRTPLNIAAWNARGDSVRILVQSGCQLDELDQSNETALDKYLPRLANLNYLDSEGIVSCIVFHGAKYCLPKHYPMAMDIVNKTKKEFIDQWPYSFNRLPKQWRDSIVEILLVLNIPRELRILVNQMVVQVWPASLRPRDPTSTSTSTS